MTSGRDVLHRIDAAISQARSGLRDIHRAASTRAETLAAIERAEADAYRRIAGIRLDHLQSDDIAQSLGESDEDAMRLIESHDHNLDSLVRRMSEAEQIIERLEKNRRQREDALEQAVAAHDRGVEKTNARL